MEEDKENADRTYILHQKKIDMEERSIAQCPHIRKLISHILMRYEPAKEDTGKEAH
jgi:hypothetical protein